MLKSNEVMFRCRDQGRNKEAMENRERLTTIDGNMVKYGKFKKFCGWFTAEVTNEWNHLVGKKMRLTKENHV